MIIIIIIIIDHDAAIVVIVSIVLIISIIIIITVSIFHHSFISNFTKSLTINFNNVIWILMYNSMYEIKIIDNVMCVHVRVFKLDMIEITNMYTDVYHS